jgi:hypothetical protein
MTSESPGPGRIFQRPQYSVLIVILVVVLVGTFLAAPWRHADPKSDVRVRNASGVPVHHVIVGNTVYGDIEASGTTGYKQWGPAYPHPRVEFELGGAHLRQIPDDHYGETVLGAGRFTYVLIVGVPKSESDFSIVATKD